MLIHPFMLAWLGGAAVPLVLHLLSRSRYRAVNWGAMMFLTGPDAAAQHTARIKQWILLVLRMGTVGLLAIALARPVVSARHAAVPTAGLVTGSTAAVVIILNDSPSMSYTTGDKSRMDLARQVTLQLLTALKRGDEAALLLPGNRDYQMPAALSPDLQSIASKVSDLQPDIMPPDFAKDITRAADLLDHAGPVDREIYIISDRQAMPWKTVLSDTFMERWLARKSAGSFPRVALLPVGGDESDNIAVDKIEFPDKPVMRGQTTSMQIQVRNYGPTAVTDVPLQIWPGDTSDRTITVPARSSRSVIVPWRFGEAGSHVVSAAVRSTGLTTDDRLDVAVDVVEKLRVMIIDSAAPAATTRSTTQPLSPLHAALAAANRPGYEIYAITDLAPSDLNAQTLKRADVLILNNVGRIAPPQAKAIKQFTDAGGGVLIIPGNATKIANLNSTLHDSGISALPAMLKGTFSKATRVAGFDRQHPIFRFLSGKADPFPPIPITRVFQTVPNPANTRTLAKFASGDPFIIESNMSHGDAILMTTALDRDWNSLPQSPVLQPLIQSTIHYLGAGAAVNRNVDIYSSVVVGSDEPVDGNSAMLQSLTDATRVPIAVTHSGDRTEVSYHKPGAYRLRYKSGGVEKSVDFVVNAGHGSSDLTPLSDAQWKTLGDRANLERVNLSKTTVAAAVERQRGGREVWIDLLGGVLLLMVTEMLLARWWSQS